MEIVKSLDINKRYNFVPNGSIVMAKNMRVSDDLSGLEIDEGFKDILAEAIASYNELHPNDTISIDPIVGIIECPKEVVIFTHSILGNIDNIYRLKELDNNNVEIVKCKTAWVYNGYKSGNNYINSHINGTYTYNVKGELIVTIGEYLDDNSKDIPLRVINLDLDTSSWDVSKYNVAPNVPIANMSLNELVSGTPIPNGIYYFFIRYELSNNEYTNWFPIGKEYYAISEQNINIFNHQHGSNSGIQSEYFPREVNNLHKDYYFNFSFSINFINNTFDRCQIGYILQHEASTVGRVYKDFTITNNNLTFTFDAKFKEETSIDELIENPIDLLNVHCITNFENRTYIANYKESIDINNSALQALASNINVSKVEGSSITAYGSKELLNLDELNNATVTYGIRDNRIASSGGDDDIPETVNLSFDISNVNGIKVSASSVSTSQSFLNELQSQAGTDANYYYSNYPFIARNWYALDFTNSQNTITDSNLMDKNIFILSSSDLSGYSETKLRADNPYTPRGENSINVLYFVFPKYSVTSRIHIEFTGATDKFNIYSPYQFYLGESSTTADVAFPAINTTDFVYSTTSIWFIPKTDKYCAIPIICQAINQNINLVDCIFKNVHVYSDGHIALSSETQSSSQSVTSDIVIKPPFYFTVQNNVRYLPLLTLLNDYGFANWLFGTNIASSITENTGFELDSHQVQTYVKYLAIDLYSFAENGGITFVQGQFNNGNPSHLEYHKNVSIVSTNVNNTYYIANNFVWYTKSGISIDEEYSSNTTVKQDIGTFDPEEYYDFYIHYIQKNGCHTKGYKIGTGFTPSNKYGLYRCYPQFSNITIPSPFVGYFISYKQKSNRRIFTGVFTREYLNNNKGVIVGKFSYPMKATDVEIGLNNYIGDTLIFENNDGDKNDYATKEIDIPGCDVLLAEQANTGKSRFGGGTDVPYNTIGYPGCIVIATKGDNNVTVVSNANGNFGGSSTNINTITNLDNVRIGTVMNLNAATIDDDYLIKFTPIVNTAALNPSSYDCVYPCYITQDIIYDFNQRIMIDQNTGEPIPIGANSTNFGQISKDSKISSTYLTIYYLNKYCKYNLKALHIKKEPTILVVAQESDLTRFKRITYVPTIDSHDLYGFDVSFINKEHKVYKKYLTTDNFINHFTKTIRRSNILSDESSLTSIRNFNANQYKVISNDKGNITALVSLGSDLLIHTENTLFRLSKQAILEADAHSVDITSGDLFNVEPQEVFTSNHGYGGLQVENNWCVNENGYWFHDRDNHKLFNLDNGQLNDLSEPIVKYLNSVYPVSVTFNTDFKNNRVLICFKESNNSEHNPVTFSYNVRTKSFISLHDFKFNTRCNTKNNVYFIGEIGYYDPNLGLNIESIYKFNSINDRNYYALSSVPANFPEFVDSDWDAQQVSAIIDIIFNAGYPACRTLNSINYALNYKEEYNDFSYKLFEDVDKYSGNYMEIYTNVTDSRILDISQHLDQNNDVNQYNNYKIPFYNKGEWQVNYFRNTISKALTSAQLAKYFERIGIEDAEDIEAISPYIINNIPDNDIPSSGDAIRPSDSRSLIYGKYIIVRFIFTDINNKQIKLENVNLNISSY